MGKLKKEKYRKYNIYFLEEKYKILAEKIIEKNFKEIKKIKDTKRNFVSLIEIDGNKYIYKEPRNEYRIPQRQFMTLFKKGEALTTLINVNKLIDMGFKEFVKPLTAVNIRRKGIINFSFFVMEYVLGEEDRRYLDEIVKKMEEIHRKGYYHGDFNPGNFLITDGKIKILDTQGKKMGLTKYRAHYDMITMQYDSYEKMKYPYKKDIIYHLAYFIKRLKRLPVIEKIGRIKKKLRDKGWKI
ncbi:lipopolysaccharide core heptose(II) kinase RfaY [Fusobacterium ulcerans]|uniref:lipopolysaccharide core heptose(II) kinase RfaY n=1 Tax=Fusobacterium ulcerans TaxID=861 RepID=UPI0030A1A83C